MFGGLISIIVKVFLCLFIYLRCDVLISGTGDENSTQNYLLGDDVREEIFNYKDIQFMLTPGIRSVRDGKKVINYDEAEVKKHIELTFVQMF